MVEGKTFHMLIIKFQQSETWVTVWNENFFSAPLSTLCNGEYFRCFLFVVFCPLVVIYFIAMAVIGPPPAHKLWSLFHIPYEPVQIFSNIQKELEAGQSGQRVCSFFFVL